MRTTKIITVLNAVTAASTASGKIYVGDSTRLSLHVRRAAHTSGTSTFSVKIGMESPGTVTPVMTAYNMLIDNVTNTNGQMLTRVSSKVLSGDGDAFLFFDEAFKFNWIEITGAVATDGNASVFLLIEQE